MTTTSAPENSRTEPERKLAASAERHREVAASIEQLGRSEAGQYMAVKSLARAVDLVSFALKGAAQAGVPFERLVELTGWEPDLVREGLELEAPEPRFVARLVPPAGPDAAAVAQTTAAFEAIRRLQDLAQRVLTDVDREADDWSLPALAQLDDLHYRLENAWRSWRKELGHREA
jgi:hypothetical protein